MIYKIIFIVLFLLVPLQLFKRFFLNGPDLSNYQDRNVAIKKAPSEISSEHNNVVGEVEEFVAKVTSSAPKNRVALFRRLMDEIGEVNGSLWLERLGNDAPIITKVDVDGILGEWVIAPNSDPDRRLLYIHGGGYLYGSTKSHRSITIPLAALAGVSVLVFDYRLMPEHKRQAGIDDCRKAWLFLVENGPKGPSLARDSYIAGDSAGGNLTLSLINWLIEQGLSRPNAIVALSPGTDSTFSSPSIRENLATDPLIGPFLKQSLSMPRFFMLLFNWLFYRVPLSKPDISPIFADLSNLPPTLLQVSRDECMFDDACRYATKACAAGSPVILQVWPLVVHGWQLFGPKLPEACEAIEEIVTFIGMPQSAIIMVLLCSFLE